MKRALRYLTYLSILATGRAERKEDAFNLLVKFAKRVLPEYRLTFPQMTWWNDKNFNQFLKKFDEDQGFNSHRKFALSQLIRLTEYLEGDTAECGTYKGASSFLILDSNKNSIQKKHHHVFDSFEGLSNPSRLDGTHWQAGDLEIAEDLVEAYLAPYGRHIDYQLYRDWIPNKFREVEDCKFSFIHIDVDLYQPTLDSISFFYERIVLGGILLCDDYGFTTCPGATAAIDEFLRDKPEKMIMLPDGGGFFIKGTRTG
jgi:O-methyltransferase